MRRTSTQGLLFSVIAALVPSCGDEDNVCQLDVCGTGCVNLNADPLHCGQCFNECGTNEACEVGVCEPTDLVCTAPEIVCGDACVNTQVSADHCGTCDAPCGADVDCVGGVCTDLIVALRTVIESKGDIERDVYVVKNGTFEVTKLGNTTFTGSRIIDHAVLPDGRILLVGAQETEGVFELFLSEASGGALVKLSGTLVAGGSVLDGLAVSADGTKVLFRADKDVDDQIDLYAVAIATPGATVKVNGALVAGGVMSRVFSLSENGNRAVYIADQEQPGVDELYTVDLSQATPGASVKLSAAPSNTGVDVWDFVATPDLSRVVYRSNDTTNLEAQLFVADVATAGTVARITNTTEPDYHALEDYSISSDGTTAIYTGGESFFNEGLYTSALGVAVPDSALLADATTGMVRAAKALAGGAVFFRRDIDFGNPRLFTVNTAGTPVVAEVVDAQITIPVDRVVVSRNGQHLVFGAGGDGGESGLQNRGTEGGNFFGRSFELYHVDLTAAFPQTPTRIAQFVQSGHDGIEHDLFVRDDGSVIFRADLDTAGTTEVYIGHPSAPDTSIKLSPVLGDNDATDVRSIKRF